MAAPPPPPHAPIAVDDDDDDGFDWEAAVRQIDDACARASASASASAPPPDPDFSSEAPGPDPLAAAAAAAFDRPSAGGARQSTLDRFVESFTRRQTEKDRAPPPAAPSESKLGRFVESFTRRQMDKDRVPPAAAAAAPTESKLDRFVESFTRRQQVKERPPPAAAPAGSERRSRRVDQEEASEEPCPSGVPLDPEALQTWIYPTNVEVREYQQYIVQRALFTNTLVALPTGLGKTFIAAAVMYNYFRWFPGGKIVFTAPSRPLVTQQIEACHNTVGIPQEWTIDMKGNLTPPKRASFWKSKRVFFVTPQVLENDIQSGICIAKELVCLVIDEAHKASGNHSYCIAVRELVAARVPLRILALTATPGSKHSDIQGVINNLRISELVHCDENDPKVSRYVQTRTLR